MIASNKELIQELSASPDNYDVLLVSGEDSDSLSIEKVIRLDGAKQVWIVIGDPIQDSYLGPDDDEEPEVRPKLDDIDGHPFNCACNGCIARDAARWLDSGSSPATEVKEEKPDIIQPRGKLRRA